MTDFQQKRKFRKIAYSRITIIAIFILVFFLSRSTYNIFKKERASSTSYSEIKNEYDGLKDRQSMLNSAISRLKTNIGIEEEIRSKFSVAKPGETVVVVIDGGNASSSTTDSNGGGFWQRIVDLFK